MVKSYPFKFLDSYTSKDTSIFFGREEEIKSLYEMVYQTNILLVCGASGTGKTSLIQCGLAKKFQRYDWLPILIRRGDDINRSLVNSLCAEASISPDTNPSLEDVIESAYLLAFRPIYLIFDQFEELYILGTEPEQAQFIKNIERILKIGESVKIIIAIREEYLGHLYGFEKKIPQLGRKKIRIESMNLGKVQEVLNGINQHEHSLFKLAPHEENEIIESIFDTIKGNTQSLNIQLTYLQVFMDKLYMLLSNDEKRETEVVCRLVDIQKVGEIDDVLGSFLDDRVKKIHEETGVTAETIWRMLSKFATLKGTKEPISINVLAEKLSDYSTELVNTVIDKFGKSQVLRFNEKEQTWEITHDSLAQRIADKRTEEEKILLQIHDIINSQIKLPAGSRGLLTERQLHIIEPYLGKVKLNQQEQDLIRVSTETLKSDLRFKKGRLWLLRSLVIVLVAFLAYIAILYSAANKSRNAFQKLSRDLADQVRENAETNYKKSSGNYDSFVTVAGLLYHQNDYNEALRFARLAIRENFDYILLVRTARANTGSDTLYKYPTIDNGADSARDIQKLIQQQLSMQQNIAQIKAELERVRGIEQDSAMNNPLIYYEAKILYDNAERKLNTIPGSNEFVLLKKEINTARSMVKEKLKLSLHRLFDRASKFVAEPEGYTAAQKLLNDAYKIDPSDPRINELQKRMKK
jgi:hypothetical protein